MLLEIAVVIAVLFAVLVVFGRAYIYDAVITSMTSTWYVVHSMIHGIYIIAQSMCSIM